MALPTSRQVAKIFSGWNFVPRVKCFTRPKPIPRLQPVINTERIFICVLCFLQKYRTPEWHEFSNSLNWTAPNLNARTLNLKYAVKYCHWLPPHLCLYWTWYTPNTCNNLGLRIRHFFPGFCLKSAKALILRFYAKYCSIL